MSRRVSIFLGLLAIASCATTLRAAGEVHSNGTGGGLWSDSATWRTKTVPGPDDSAIVSAGDAVVFDRDDSADGKRSCKDVYIDPEGSLTFKAGGKRVLSVQGPIESYGVIKLDASASADDLIEVRFTGPAAQRNLKLVKGGAFVTLGKSGLPDGKKNVIIRSIAPAPPAPAAGAPAPPPMPIADTLGYIDGVVGTSIDLHQTQFDGMTVRASTIDNTGAKPNERVVIADNHVTGGATIAVAICDTPSIVNNVVEYSGDPLSSYGISVGSCPLAEIRGNTVNGKFSYGIFGSAQSDSVVANNSITATNGIYWYGGNDMLKGNTIHGGGVGIVLTSMTGALEEITFDGCREQALTVSGATIQATSLRFTNLPKECSRVFFVGGSATFVNCDITPEQIKMNQPIPVTPKPRVMAMQYCVVNVKGTLPAGAAVDIATANPPKPLAKGAIDLNIRNNPAAIGSGGLTPLPHSLKSLMVKTWTIEGNGALTPSPQYSVSVTSPPDKPDGEPKKLKTVTITPDASWYRAMPNEPTPTMEIAIP